MSSIWWVFVKLYNDIDDIQVYMDSVAWFGYLSDYEQYTTMSTVHYLHHTFFFLISITNTYLT